MGLKPGENPAPDADTERPTGSRPAPIEIAPMEVDSQRIAFTGLALFTLATVGLLPFYGWLGDHGHRIWLWTSIAGVGVGLLGYLLTRRHKAAGRTK